MFLKFTKLVQLLVLIYENKTDLLGKFSLTLDFPFTKFENTQKLILTS